MTAQPLTLAQVNAVSDESLYDGMAAEEAWREAAGDAFRDALKASPRVVGIETVPTGGGCAATVVTLRSGVTVVYTDDVAPILSSPAGFPTTVGAYSPTRFMGDEYTYGPIGGDCIDLTPTDAEDGGSYGVRLADVALSYAYGPVTLAKSPRW